MLKALSIGLAVALVASIGLNIAVRRGAVTRTPLEYFPDMTRTVRYNAFESNPNFADGMTLRVPPPGTIPRGLLPMRSEPTSGPDGTPVNPFKPEDTGAVERGGVVYKTYCVPCHDEMGEGNGLVVQRGFPAPPTLLRARTRAMDDATLFTIITTGTGTMPPYGAQIAREDRWKAILHVRKLQNESAPAGGAQ